MTVLRQLLLMLLMLLAPLATRAASAPSEQATLEVYVRSGCPHCAAAKSYLPRFAAARPALRVVFRDVDNDPEARDSLARHSRAANIWPPGVPTFVYADRILVGFEGPEQSAAALAALISGEDAPRSKLDSPWFGPLSVERLGLPLFTLSIGLLDGFNPCATWVLLFLLSLLIHLHHRGRMALVAATFVLVSGAVYYAFMAAWLNVFLLLELSTPLRLALAAIALAVGSINLWDAFGRPLGRNKGYTLAIPAAAKPGLYGRMRTVLRAESLPASLAAVSVLAVMVNFIELLCTAGFPAMYTTILSQQGLSTAAHYAYLGLYIVGYIADDTLMVVVAVIALTSFKLNDRSGHWLKLLSGLMMLLLGAVMAVRPQWLF